MNELKDSWKQTGKGLGSAFTNLGKSIVKSVKVGVHKADEWVNDDEGEKKTPPKENEENK
ncbi:MAG TPA: hypothetical protein P5116_04745 [Eubacteriales bacterium]|nr:hypothetical protein [Clostridia bacterium]HRV73167.1 hypothetical protein [Eubacteriales bacterium]